MVEHEICIMSTDSEMDEKGYVHWRAWHETYTGIIPDDYLCNVTLEKCVKMAHKFPQNTLLLKINHGTVGFACIKKRTDVKDTNEIIAIYLLEEYHGKKLGYELLKHTVSLFEDSLPIVLWVLKGNEKAIRFYKKVGFEFTGNEKDCPFGIELQMEMKSLTI